MRYEDIPAGMRRALWWGMATLGLYLVPIGLVLDDMSRPVVCDAGGSGSGGAAGYVFLAAGLAGLIGTAVTFGATAAARRETEAARVWPLRLAVVVAPIVTVFLLFDDAVRGLQCGFF
jgi:hypothetical protein